MVRGGKWRLLRAAVVSVAVIGSLSGVAGRSTGTADSALFGAPAQHGTSRTAGSPPSGPLAVVIVVDAARADEFDPSRMPNLAALVARGTQFADAWVGQLPSITETSHATIGTGVLPRRHLILGDTWRVPGTNQMAPSLLDGNLTRTGYIGKFIQRTGVPTLAGMVHGAYPGSIVASLSGHKVYAADAMSGGAADLVAFGSNDKRGHFVPSGIPGHVPAPAILKDPKLDLPKYPRAPGVEDTWTINLASDILARYYPRVLMVNLPEVDVTGHVAGTDGKIMQPLMATVDTDIGLIVAAYQKANLLDRTYFIVTSDHGMVPGIRTVAEARIDDLITRAGGVPLYVGHGDYVPIWLKNPDVAPMVAVSLSNANIPDVAAVYLHMPGGGYRLLSPAGRLADPSVASAYAHMLSTLDSAEAPDLAVLYDENTMTMKPSYLAIGRKADHGGATWGAQHIPLVIAGPGVRAGATSVFPARLVDVAPTVEMLLGIQPRNQDGVPLADALAQPPSWAVTAQSNDGPASQDVASLAREAALRPNTH